MTDRRTGGTGGETGALESVRLALAVTVAWELAILSSGPSVHAPARSPFSPGPSRSPINPGVHALRLVSHDPLSHSRLENDFKWTQCHVLNGWLSTEGGMGWTC